MAELPAGLEFHAAHGAADVVLVYRAPTERRSRRDPLRLNGSVLDVPSGFPDRSRWITREERHAYRAGYAEALAAVKVFLSPPTGDGTNGTSANGAGSRVTG